MVKKNVLYAFQATGNGHAARAQRLIPVLQQHVNVTVFASGCQSELKLGFDYEQHPGISLFYNKKGGLSYWDILKRNSWLSSFNRIKHFDLSNYDLVVNDFEPLSAWACHIQNKPCIQVSHQAALLFKETPKPRVWNPFGEWVLKYYAPSKVKNRIGFHFDRFNPNIQLPLLRKEVLNRSTVSHKGGYIVYLPSWSTEKITNLLRGRKECWYVFSKVFKEVQVADNIHCCPIEKDFFVKLLHSCEGVLCNAGFELPAEALYLGKKLMVIPIKGQYEQEYNAKALGDIGVRVVRKLNRLRIEEFLKLTPLKRNDYDWEIEPLVQQILKDR